MKHLMAKCLYRNLIFGLKSIIIHSFPVDIYYFRIQCPPMCPQCLISLTKEDLVGHRFSLHHLSCCCNDGAGPDDSGATSPPHPPYAVLDVSAVRWRPPLMVESNLLPVRPEYSGVGYTPVAECGGADGPAGWLGMPAASGQIWWRKSCRICSTRRL